MTPEVDVLYDEECCYSVIVKDNVMSIGEFAFYECIGHLGDSSRRVDQHRKGHSGVHKAFQ